MDECCKESLRGLVRSDWWSSSIVGMGNDAGDPVRDELMRADTCYAGHRTGNSSDGAAEFVRTPGDGHRSRANASLDNDGRCGERGHQPRPSDEAMARRHRARRNLTDQEAEVSHPLKQFTVPHRVGAINAVRHDRDRVAA